MAYNDAAIAEPTPGHNQPTTRARTRRGNARASASTTTKTRRFTPNGSGTATPAQTATHQELNGSRAPAAQGQQTPTRLSFANPDPPMTTWEAIGTRANKANSAPVAPATGTGIPLTNGYEPIAEHGSGTNDRESERLSFGSMLGASGSHSSARNRWGKEPIPLTPEILHLLDRLEPVKGKHARFLTEHTTGQRQLPSTEHELQ